jgi:carbon storage regulator
MLVLTRKVGESVVIDGQIVVSVLRLEGDTLKLGIQAPARVSVHRQEVYEEIQRTNRQALTDVHTPRSPLPQLEIRP